MKGLFQHHRYRWSLEEPGFLTPVRGYYCKGLMYVPHVVRAWIRASTCPLKPDAQWLWIRNEEEMSARQLCICYSHVAWSSNSVFWSSIGRVFKSELMSLSYDRTFRMSCFIINRKTKVSANLLLTLEINNRIFVGVKFLRNANAKIFNLHNFHVFVHMKSWWKDRREQFYKKYRLSKISHS